MRQHGLKDWKFFVPQAGNDDTDYMPNANRIGHTNHILNALTRDWRAATCESKPLHAAKVS